MDLLPIMTAQAPFWTREGEELQFYYLQCLNVLHYIPEIRKQVMELVIDKALEIDVNIKIQDGGNVILDDDVDEAQNDGEKICPALSANGPNG